MNWKKRISLFALASVLLGGGAVATTETRLERKAKDIGAKVLHSFGFYLHNELSDDNPIFDLRQGLSRKERNGFLNEAGNIYDLARKHFGKENVFDTETEDILLFYERFINQNYHKKADVQTIACTVATIVNHELNRSDVYYSHEWNNDAYTPVIHYRKDGVHKKISFRKGSLHLPLINGRTGVYVPPHEVVFPTYTNDFDFGRNMRTAYNSIVTTNLAAQSDLLTQFQDYTDKHPSNLGYRALSAIVAIHGPNPQLAIQAMDKFNQHNPRNPDNQK